MTRERLAGGVGAPFCTSKVLHLAHHIQPTQGGGYEVTLSVGLRRLGAASLPGSRHTWI